MEKSESRLVSDLRNLRVLPKDESNSRMVDIFALVRGQGSGASAPGDVPAALSLHTGCPSGAVALAVSTMDSNDFKMSGDSSCSTSSDEYGTDDGTVTNDEAVEADDEESDVGQETLPWWMHRSSLDDVGLGEESSQLVGQFQHMSVSSQHTFRARLERLGMDGRKIATGQRRVKKLPAGGNNNYASGQGLFPNASDTISNFLHNADSHELWLTCPFRKDERDHIKQLAHLYSLNLRFEDPQKKYLVLTKTSRTRDLKIRDLQTASVTPSSSTHTPHTSHPPHTPPSQSSTHTQHILSLTSGSTHSPHALSKSASTRMFYSRCDGGP